MNEPAIKSRRITRTHDPRYAQAKEKRCFSMEDVGAVFKRRRKELGYSQTDIAAMCGFSQRLVSEMENGRGTVGIDKVILYATVLDVGIIIQLLN